MRPRCLRKLNLETALMLKNRELYQKLLLRKSQAPSSIGSQSHTSHMAHLARRFMARPLSSTYCVLHWSQSRLSRSQWRSNRRADRHVRAHRNLRNGRVQNLYFTGIAWWLEKLVRYSPIRNWLLQYLFTWLSDYSISVKVFRQNCKVRLRGGRLFLLALCFAMTTHCEVVLPHAGNTVSSGKGD